MGKGAGKKREGKEERGREKDKAEERGAHASTYTQMHRNTHTDTQTTHLGCWVRWATSVATSTKDQSTIKTTAPVPRSMPPSFFGKQTQQQHKME